ncbi:2-acyl-glycerophospho-ethanolamine acyltransferase [Actinomadura rubteroloni]|uniref:2-acyl-glycerophospho-ethanolamine acyltransferase n=1 Tax=Actinomadura rubteroloni TaxID=1926885 RepID=A0A2P4UMF0_9ACTN|nr:MFS transporter [Actinomadura rubteroloni]POM26224.1 2-acyl-glycerophospho-ethanolamine acyltransferase [Actinomadura rubteroloni]
MRAGELGAILRGRDFRRLYATRLTSQLTDGVFQVALAGYVFFSPERQASPGEAAAAFAVTLLPYSVLGPFVGVFIDRWRRRRILIWTPVVRAALLLLVAALVGTGHDGALFFLLVLVALAVNRFFLAALSAALPQVVARPHLVTANAFAVTSGTVVAFAGAGIGYGLRGLAGGGARGTALLLVAAAALFALAGLVASRLPHGPLGRADHAALANVLRGLADGARHVADRRPAALALAAVSVHRLLYGVVLMMTLLLCRERFSDGDADAGLTVFATMLAVSGVGYFVAAVITPPIVRRISKPVWTALLLSAGGLALAVLGPPFAPVPWAIGAFLLGVVSQGVKLCTDTTLQESIEDAYRGRVFTLYDMLFNAVFAASAAATAAVLHGDGASVPVLAAVIAAYLASAAVFRLGSRALAPV